MKPNNRPNPSGFIGAKKESQEVLRRRAHEAKIRLAEEKRIKLLQERQKIEQERKLKESQKFIIVDGKKVLISEMLNQERLRKQREEEQARKKQKVVLVNGKPVLITESLKSAQNQKPTTPTQTLSKIPSQPSHHLPTQHPSQKNSSVRKRTSAKKQGPQISTSTKLVFLASGKKVPSKQQ